MGTFDSNQDLITSKSLPNNQSHFHQKEHHVLCNHCKRTPTNGIRCLGMCVADNDY